MNLQKENSLPFPLACLLASVSLILLAVVDLRRGFLFSKTSYILKNSFVVFSPYQTALVLLGLIGLTVFVRQVNKPNTRAAKALLFGIFVLLLVDAGLYRGVAASRSLQAGKLGTDWLGAFGTSGVWKPLALSASYLLTVWHATFLSCLGAGLGLLILPRFLPSSSREGWRGSFHGMLYSLTQPFCSCCAALTSPSLFSAQRMNFAVAVLLGAPLLNISTLILAGQLLPFPFALLRILGGLLTTLGLSFVLAKWIKTREPDFVPTSQDVKSDRPSVLFLRWLKLSGRVALVLIPSMAVGTVLSSLVWMAWPTGLGNTFLSVVLTSTIGSLVMVSTWSEIPLAAQMLQHGLTGPAAAALVALPAVNFGSLFIIAKVSRNWRVAIGLGVGVMLISTFAGLSFL